MHSFKKALISSFIFILLITIISSALISTFFNTESTYYQDKKYRDEMAGSIDCIFIGASRCQGAFVPKIIDKELQVNSYNLSGSAMSPAGKIAIVKEEIIRNPIKKIFIEVNEEDLFFDNKGANSEGEIYLLPRLSKEKRLSYFLQNVYIKDYFFLYSFYVNNGFNALIDLLLKNYSSAVDIEKKGFLAHTQNDIFLTPNQCNELYQTKTLPDNYNNTAISQLIELIETCKSTDSEIYLITVPVSEKKLWETKDNDAVFDFYTSLADKYGCRFLDFNLYKEKSNYISDKTSFDNDGHMAEFGAEKFSYFFCDVMKLIFTDHNVTDLFYDSYREALNYSPYNQWRVQ